jgi:hypothetical protein
MEVASVFKECGVIGLVLLDLLFMLVAGLAWWQFTRSLRSGKARIKGWTFERTIEPFHYWSNTIMFGVAGIMTTGLGAVLLFALISGDVAHPQN